MGWSGCRSEPVAVAWLNEKECVCVLGEDVQFLGEEDEVLTGFSLSVPRKRES